MGLFAYHTYQGNGLGPFLLIAANHLSAMIILTKFPQNPCEWLRPIGGTALRHRCAAGHAAN
jgi:hypothetical protein